MDKWIVEAMELCRKLQDKGEIISLTSSTGNIELDHREPVNYELICKITIRDTENSNAVASLMDYIHAVKTEVGICK